MPRKVSILPKGQSAAAIYTDLKKDIVELRLAPASQIEEAQLLERFKLSRTPVREALTRLASEGLVELRTNRSALVSSIDVASAATYLESLEVISTGISQLAAVRRTEAKLDDIRSAQAAFRRNITENPAACTGANREFHSRIGAASGNRYLQLQYDRLLDNGMRLANIPFQFAEEGETDRIAHLTRAADQHDDLIDAIADRDGARAVHIAKIHCQLFRGRLFRYLAFVTEVRT